MTVSNTKNDEEQKAARAEDHEHADVQTNFCMDGIWQMPDMFGLNGWSNFGRFGFSLFSPVPTFNDHFFKDISERDSLFVLIFSLTCMLVLIIAVAMGWIDVPSSRAL